MGSAKEAMFFQLKDFSKCWKQTGCQDLLKDTNDALILLDSVNEKYTPAEKKCLKSFTFDFKSLYDNLKPELVIQAVETAVIECRRHWIKSKREWILTLIDISLCASIGKFKDNFYRQKKGVFIGGSLCVQLANITVYHLICKAVYAKSNLMSNLKEAKRYINDGASLYSGSKKF